MTKPVRLELRVKDMTVSKGHTCSPGKAAKGLSHVSCSQWEPESPQSGLSGDWKNLAPSLGLASDSLAPWSPYSDGVVGVDEEDMLTYRVPADHQNNGGQEHGHLDQ